MKEGRERKTRGVLFFFFFFLRSFFLFFCFSSPSSSQKAFSPFAFPSSPPPITFSSPHFVSSDAKRPFPVSPPPFALELIPSGCFSKC